MKRLNVNFIRMFAQMIYIMYSSCAYQIYFWTILVRKWKLVHKNICMICPINKYCRCSRDFFNIESKFSTDAFVFTAKFNSELRDRQYLYSFGNKSHHVLIPIMFISWYLRRLVLPEEKRFQSSNLLTSSRYKPIRHLLKKCN